MTGPDVLVVGGGVVGLFCAYHLRRRGATVTVVERGPVGGAQSCSSNNTGFVGTHGADTQRLRAMKRDSLTILRELCAAGPLADCFAEPGMVLAFRTAEEFARSRARLPVLVAMGIPIRVLEPDELAAVEPGLTAIGALYNEEGAYLRVPEFVRTFAEVLAKSGVDILADTEVVDIETTGNAVCRVITSRDDFQPAELVLAAGVWSAPIARRLGVQLPLRPVKGHTVTVKGPSPRHPVTLGSGDAVLAVAPTADGFRVGGTREQAGMDTSASPRQVRHMLSTVREYLPQLGEAVPGQVWTGLRPCTPDGLPLLGRARPYRNLSLACGHGHIGMGLAPAGGLELAELMLS